MQRRGGRQGRQEAGREGAGRRTGGLADTVEDEVTEFTFDGTDEGSLDVALNKTIDWHRTRASKWEEIAVSNMETDFGWSRSATMYLDLYRSL